MTIGGKGPGPITAEIRKKAEKAVMTAFESGITLFDHADIYAYGESEELFGEILAKNTGMRDRIVIQTKCGIRRKDDPKGAPGRYDFSARHIINAVEGSLKRLCTDYVDILLLHRPDPLGDPEEVARALDELHRGGKVRYFGVSNHTPGQIELLQKCFDETIVLNQLELNLIHTQLVNEGIEANREVRPEGILDYCRLHTIMIQAWAPLAGGKLSGPAKGPYGKAVKAVSELSKEKSTSKEAVLLAWIMRHPARIQPVIGSTDPGRIKASCLADGITLTREEWYRLFTAARGEAVP